MGLDLALGIVILIVAFRGWFQGFVVQAVRIGGLIACVYCADPVRDFAKPRVLPYLPSIQPDLVDRLLWWVSAVATYVVLVGIAMVLAKMTRRPEIPGIPPASRNDQFAGFFVGATKGVLIAALLVAGMQKYAMHQINNISWAEQQAQGSWALKWNEKYQPVAKIWSSRPVRHFVNHIHRMGLQNPADRPQSPDSAEADEDPPVQTASRSREFDAPVANEADPNPRSISPPAPPSSATGGHSLGAEVEKDIEDIKSELNLRRKGSN
jgi:uncharacterized membrane protein required for colicin V production